MTLFGVDALHTLKRNLMLQLLEFDSKIRIFGNGSGEAAFETRGWWESTGSCDLRGRGQTLRWRLRSVLFLFFWRLVEEIVC